MRGLTNEERKFLTVTGATTSDAVVSGLVARGLLVHVCPDNNGLKHWRTTTRGQDVLRLDFVARTVAA